MPSDIDGEEDGARCQGVLSPAAAQRLKPLLDGLDASTRASSRRALDPVDFGHLYLHPRDVEVASLIAAALAYGRADVFRATIAALLGCLGPHPARALADLTVGRAREMLAGFVYRFNVAADIGVLFMGIGTCLERHGSLEAAFSAGGTDRYTALTNFAQALKRAAPRVELERALGPVKGLGFLLPEGGAHKRLNLYLRWMVRPSDGVDFGIWKDISPSSLVVPLDVHVARVGRALGLCQRRTLDWAGALEVTASLRLLEPADPLKYDFALCHHGMSGGCPAALTTAHCQRCVLQAGCFTGRAVHQRFISSMHRDFPAIEDE